MRDIFIFFLKLQAWLSLVGGAFYGYVLASAAAPPDLKLGLGVMGGLLGLLASGIAWLMYMGAADLAATTWDNQRALAVIGERLESISKAAGKDEEEEAAQLAALVSKVTEVKGSIDDLHEGLSDVMEETLSRISGIKDAVTTTPKG